MALDGVGPSIARGNQFENGTCALFPIAANTSKIAMTVAAPDGTRHSALGHVPAKIRSKSPEPTARCTITAAAKSPTSQMRYVVNARSAAFTALDRS